MQVIDFLSAVLPPPSEAYYCAVELKTRAKEHKFVKTLEELHEAALLFDKAKKDTYFALAVFESSDSRTAANSTRIKCLFADIDVGEGKPYAHAENAVASVVAWAAEHLGVAPVLVHSGFGVHCYWPFSEAVSVDEWRPVAENFKRACAANGLGIDFSVSADSARVLRLPGTHNYKRDAPREVTILSNGGENFHPFSYFLSLIHISEPTRPCGTSRMPSSA